MLFRLFGPSPLRHDVSVGKGRHDAIQRDVLVFQQCRRRGAHEPNAAVLRGGVLGAGEERILPGDGGGDDHLWVEWGAAGGSGQIAPCFARKVDEELQTVEDGKQVDFDATEVRFRWVSVKVEELE